MNNAYNEDEDLLLRNDKILIMENKMASDADNSEDKIETIKSIDSDHKVHCYICKKIMNIISLGLILFTLILLPLVFNPYVYGMKNFYNIFKPNNIHFQMSFEVFFIIWVLMLGKILFT
jgi:hypothetical protein